jgi:CAAX amino terminal protease family.
VKDYLLFKKYSTKESILAIFYYVYLVLLTMLYFYIVKHVISSTTIASNNINKEIFKLVLGFINAFFQLIPIYILFKKYNHTFKDIGINFSNFFKDIIKGIVFFIPILFIYTFFYKMIFHLNISQESLIEYFIQLVLVAFVEEIIFRGYLQSRISSMIKNKFFSILIVSLMFSILHFIGAFSLQKLPNNLKETIIPLSLALLIRCIKHFYLTYICTKSNSLFASTITHFLNNIC